MQRIYFNHENKSNLIIKDKEIHHQLTKVLRQKVWNEVIFFDGVSFSDFVYKIESIEKKEITFALIEEIPKEKENSIIVLNQATPNKLDKLELILQKWVEVWVSEFVFFSSERSQKLVISDNKLERLNKIVVEAVEQSWRNIIPKILFEKTVKKWENSYFFHTKSDNSITLFDIKPYKKINLYVWPEGWFSENEVSFFEDFWAKRVTLWKNILRCETASITASFFVSQIKD
jgi:16S rRNA (uracil1498-N3)-methyltransferase